MARPIHSRIRTQGTCNRRVNRLTELSALGVGRETMTGKYMGRREGSTPVNVRAVNSSSCFRATKLFARYLVSEYFQCNQCEKLKVLLGLRVRRCPHGIDITSKTLPVGLISIWNLRKYAPLHIPWTFSSWLHHLLELNHCREKTPFLRYIVHRYISNIKTLGSLRYPCGQGRYYHKRVSITRCHAS